MLGEFLYALTAKDAITAPVMQRLVLPMSQNAALATLTPTSAPIPQDKVGLVLHISVSADPGAGQTCRTIVVTLRNPDGSFFANLFVVNPDPGIAADIAVGGSMQTQFLMFPGELIQTNGFFSAGAVANDLNCHIHMLLLPKGNLQLR